MKQRTLALLFFTVVAILAAASRPIAAPAQGGAACGFIGVSVHPMSRAFAASLGMAEPYGALFGRPLPGSPAANANIAAYDVVTAINGVPLRSFRDFAPTIAAFAPGTTIYLTTWRNRQLIDRQVVLGAANCGAQPKAPR